MGDSTYYARNREKCLARSAAYLETEKGRYSQRKAKYKKYGLTPEDYDAMLLAQGGVCAICGGGSGNNLSVDHCHQTGRVRGLLCKCCNSFLGRVFDDPQKAVDYLARR